MSDALAEGKHERYGPRSTSPSVLRFFSVTHDILGDPFWAVYRRGLKDAAEQLGCVIEHRAPLEFSPPAMATLLEEVRHCVPHGILSTIPHAPTVEAPLRAAIAAGIPVIAVNAADPRPASERIPYLFYVGAHDLEGGRRAAAELLARGPATRAISVDHYLVDNACHVARCDGFAQALAEQGIPCETIRVPGDDHEAGVETIVRYFEGQAAVDLVCTLGPPGCRMVIEALEAVDRLATVRHASFDLARDQLDAVAAGRLAFTIDSQQYLQGYLGVTFLHLLARDGLRPAGDVLTGPAVVDADGVAAAMAGVTAGVR